MIREVRNWPFWSMEDEELGNWIELEWVGLAKASDPMNLGEDREKGEVNWKEEEERS
jgi:hypothetical protein